MMEELSSMWGKFSLREEENVGVSLEAPEVEPLVKRGRSCIVGKLIADRIIPKEYYKDPLTRIWRPMGELMFNVIGENLFIAEFEHGEDKSRILEGRPWIFDGYLVSLADFDGLTPPKELKFERGSFWIRMYNLPLACMGKSTGEKIGASVGVVEEVDVWEDAAGWGEYLRVKVSIDLSSPLARGRMLHLQGRSTWVAFKFEKLPKFCYNCGVIKHGRSGCIEQGAGKKKGDEEGYPYGPWLRVAFPSRRGTGGEVRRGGRPTTGRQSKETPGRSPQPDAFQLWCPRTSENESDGGGNSIPPNPSLQKEQASMEKEQASMGREQASMEREQPNMETADSVKAKVKKGILHVNGPKVQYLGQWDVDAGRMVYELMRATDSPNKLGEEILDQQRHPRVRSVSKRQPSEEAAPNNVLPSLEDTEGLNIGPKQKEAASGDLHGGSKREARAPPISRKKRARRGTLSPGKPTDGKSPEGKRKEEILDEEGAPPKPKKGRKNVSLISEDSAEKAGAVTQPRPSQ
jgi:hypothetical protein